MLDFIRENWQFISTAIVTLLTIILFLLRKKKIIVEDSFLNGIYCAAIEAINLAEKTYINGADKKKFVVDYLMEKYPNTSKFITDTSDKWSSGKAEDVFGAIVEIILSTPQKKKEKN